MWRKFLWLFLVTIVGVCIDVGYLYMQRTQGGVGFKVKVTPDIGD